jgi:flagellar protein FliO/FliZ
MEYSLLESFLRLLFALPVVIGLAYLSLRLGRNYMHAVGRGRNIKVIETAPVTNKTYVSIVRVGREYMALGVSEGSVRVLKTLSEEEVAELIQKQEAADMQRQFVTIKDWIGSLKDDRFRKNKDSRGADRGGL